MKNSSQKKVQIYSTPTCHYCNLAKEYFDGKGVEYEEFNVAFDLGKRKEMVEITGQMGVPVIVVGNKVMVGFDEEQFDRAMSLLE